MTSAPHRSAPVLIRRKRKRFTHECQVDPECHEKAVWFCDRCMYVCAAHRHGDCCTTEVTR